MKIAAIILCLCSVTGCQSTENILSGLSYACVDIQIDGYLTDSGAQGRGIKVPSGEVLTAETVEALCQ